MKIKISILLKSFAGAMEFLHMCINSPEWIGERVAEGFCRVLIFAIADQLMFMSSEKKVVGGVKRIENFEANRGD